MEVKERGLRLKKKKQHNLHYHGTIERRGLCGGVMDSFSRY